MPERQFQQLSSPLLVAIVASAAQSPAFVTTVPFVVVPTTVTDRKRHLLDGLDTSELRLLDGGRFQQLQSETECQPISLVVTIQTSGSREARQAKRR